MNNTSKSFIKDVEFPVMMNLTNAKISPRDRSNASSHRYDSNIRQSKNATSKNQDNNFGLSANQYFNQVFIKRVSEQSALIDIPERPYKYEVAIELNPKKASRLIIKALQLNGSGDFYDIVIDGQQKVREMIKHFKYSYQLICDHLRIMGNRMILINPVIL